MYVTNKAHLSLIYILILNIIYCRKILARDQRARSSFSAFALFSERLRGAARSVKTDIIASLSLHANIAEITAQELSLS